jgi:hypothetical protein
MVTALVVCSSLWIAAGTQAEKAIPPAALRQDLQTLVSTIERVHPDMYAYTTKEAFAARRAEVLRRIDRPMTSLEFFKLAAPLVTALRSGHTYMVIPGWTEHLQTDGRFHPFDVYWHGDEVILAHYYGEQSLPLGGTILSINARSATALLLDLSGYFPAEGEETNRFELERPGLLHETLWSEFQTAELRLEIRDLEGRIHKYVIRPSKLKELVREKIPHHDQGLFSCRYVSELHAAVLGIESFSLKDRAEFNAFLDRSFSEIQTREVTSLIIDLRDNPGGARFGVDALLSHLTDRQVVLQPGESPLAEAISKLKSHKATPFRGRVVVLIGKRTTSAAMGCAAAIQHHGLGVLVGEETADRLHFFGEGRRFTLPQSGLTYVVASDRTIVIGGKGRSGGLKPDYEVKQRPQDTARGADTVLDFTFKLIQHNP